MKIAKRSRISLCLKPMLHLRMESKANLVIFLARCKQNRESYRGQYVALNEGQLVACGATEAEVWQAANRAGVSVPFLAYIETKAEESFGGW